MICRACMTIFDRAPGPVRSRIINQRPRHLTCRMLVSTRSTNASSFMLGTGGTPALSIPPGFSCSGLQDARINLLHLPQGTMDFWDPILLDLARRIVIQEIVAFDMHSAARRLVIRARACDSPGPDASFKNAIEIKYWMSSRFIVGMMDSAISGIPRTRSTCFFGLANN